MTDEHDAMYDEPRDDGPQDDGGVLGSNDPAYEPGRRRKRRSSLRSCLAVLIALAIVVGGFYFVVTWGIDKVRDQFDSAEDYAGPGRGSVTYEVVSGATAGSIGRDLKAAGVVASVDAFIEAANASPEWSNLQAGYFALKKEMAAEDVVEILVDPANMVTDRVTIPEGLRVVDTVAILAKKTKYKKSDFEKVLDDPEALGLPDYAEGNPEGYLFPATYDFGPEATPESMLTAMVDRWQQAAEDADLEAAAAELGYTPAELMTIASLVEAEGRGDDMPKIARVIYNRIENPDNGVTNGLLQVDASVNYALGRSTIAVLTQDEIDSVADSPYNTYTQTGLPPTPIEAPGDDAIAAAAHPEDGDWLFYVTVNLKTGETKFTEDYDEFLGFKEELREYCATQSDRC
ncbi:MAG TPA: endolytic transglycosylase MltG [Nocardioides sp.]|nr:endolytic transglycosylase MltG [Nocardioides sp.]